MEYLLFEGLRSSNLSDSVDHQADKYPWKLASEGTHPDINQDPIMIGLAANNQAVGPMDQASHILKWKVAHAVFGRCRRWKGVKNQGARRA